MGATNTKLGASLLAFSVFVAPTQAAGYTPPETPATVWQRHKSGNPVTQRPSAAPRKVRPPAFSVGDTGDIGDSPYPCGFPQSPASRKAGDSRGQTARRKSTEVQRTGMCSGAGVTSQEDRANPATLEAAAVSVTKLRRPQRRQGQHQVNEALPCVGLGVHRWPMKKGPCCGPLLRIR